VAYSIEVEDRAKKALARTARHYQNRIAAAIDGLAEEPRPVGCQPVRTALRGTYRLRIGNYRVIYTVRDDERLVIVARVIKRGEHTYKGLGWLSGEEIGWE